MSAAPTKPHLPPAAKHRAVSAAVLSLTMALAAALYVVAASGDGGRADGHAPRGTAVPASTGAWVAAWATAPSGAEPGTRARGMAGRSVRNVVRASVAGGAARVTLSNFYGRSPLTVTHASIAVAAVGNTAVAAAGTMRRLTFSGAPAVVVPPGGRVTSDAVRIPVPQGGDVLVTTYSPGPSGPVTYHRHAQQISYVARGDRTEDVTGRPYTERTGHWRYLTALDVLSGEADGTVVALGDSITDGISSATGANHRWTDLLSDRLRDAARAGRNVTRYSVVNEGISGDRVLTDGPGRPADSPSGLSRFGRDVLERTGVRVAVIDLGINDILHASRPASPARITAGLRSLVRRAHAHGVKVVGATLMPFRGHPGWTAAREAARERINTEIRAGRVYDAYADFDAALRDPHDPRRLRRDYDSGDHLHPSDLGYRRMASVFPLGDLAEAGRGEHGER
jgi:lysophospholipase L1-like esterase